MKHILLLLIFLTTAAFGQQATNRIVEGDTFPGIYFSKNYVKNPTIERNKNNITDASSIATRSTVTPLQGTASLLVDGTGTSQLVIFSAETVDKLLYGQNCEARFTYNGDASLYLAYVRQGATKVTTNLALENQTNSKTASITFPCGDGTTGAVDVVIESNSASAAAIKIDQVYIGLATNLGTGTADTAWIAYTPTFNSNTWFTGSATGTSAMYYKLQGDDLRIRGTVTCSTAQSNIGTISLPAGFTAAATLSAHAVVGNAHAALASSNNGIGVVIEPSATVFSLGVDSDAASDETAANSNNFCTSGNIHFENVTIPIAGRGVETATRMDNSNFDWQAVICTGSWSTNTTHTCLMKRQGSDLYVKHKVTVSGAPTTATLTLTVPNSYVIDIAKIPGTEGTTSTVLSINGSVLDSGVNTFPALAVYATTTTLTVYYHTDAAAIPTALVTQAAPMTFGASDAVEIEYKVPIVGWSENQNAPLLVGGVTNSSSGLTRTEVANINCDSASAITSQHGAWVSSVGNVSGGACTVTLTSGLFSGTPYCIAQDNNTASTPVIVSAKATSTTSVGIDCATDAAAACTAYDVNLLCVGQR